MWKIVANFVHCFNFHVCYSSCFFLHITLCCALDDKRKSLQATVKFLFFMLLMNSINDFIIFNNLTLKIISRCCSCLLYWWSVASYWQIATTNNPLLMKIDDPLYGFNFVIKDKKNNSNNVVELDWRVKHKLSVSIYL